MDSAFGQATHCAELAPWPSRPAGTGRRAGRPPRCRSALTARRARTPAPPAARASTSGRRRRRRGQTLRVQQERGAARGVSACRVGLLAVVTLLARGLHLAQLSDGRGLSLGVVSAVHLARKVVEICVGLLAQPPRLLQHLLLALAGGVVHIVRKRGIPGSTRWRQQRQASAARAVWRPESRVVGRQDGELRWVCGGRDALLARAGRHGDQGWWGVLRSVDEWRELLFERPPLGRAWRDGRRVVLVGGCSLRDRRD